MRHMMDVNEALECGAHVPTVTPPILRKMVWNPRTIETINEFNTAWRARPKKKYAPAMDWNGKHVLVTGGARLHRQPRRRRAARARRAGDGVRQLLDGLPRVRAEARACAARRGRPARPRSASTRRCAGSTSCSTWRPTRTSRTTSASRASASTRTSSSTQNVLEAMRAAGVRDIAFSSTGSVYGEPAIIPTPEDAPFPVQTSIYASSKVAAEGLLTSYAQAAPAPAFRVVDLPLRVAARPALHARARRRLLPQAEGGPDAPRRCSATACRRRATCTWATASPRCSSRSTRRATPSTCSTSATPTGSR